MASVEIQVKGKTVRLDEEDLPLISQYTWSIGTHGYVQRWIHPNGKTICVLLHRELLGLRKGDRRIGDHINGNKLDNRRSNLRIVDASGSSQNVSGRGRSRYRGVYPGRSGRWQARVKFQGRMHYLGTYATEQEAAAVAEAKRRELMPFYVSR